LTDRRSFEHLKSGNCRRSPSGGQAFHTARAVCVAVIGISTSGVAVFFVDRPIRLDRRVQGRQTRWPRAESVAVRFGDRRNWPGERARSVTLASVEYLRSAARDINLDRFLKLGYRRGCSPPAMRTPASPVRKIRETAGPRPQVFQRNLGPAARVGSHSVRGYSTARPARVHPGITSGCCPGCRRRRNPSAEGRQALRRAGSNRAIKAADDGERSLPKAPA